MKKQAKIYWTLQARQDLLEIRAFIARDSPLAAVAYVRRLRLAVNRLSRFPESGQVVPELNNPLIREVIYGYYRLIYRVRNERVEILTVFHGMKLLDESVL